MEHVKRALDREPVRQREACGSARPALPDLLAQDGIPSTQQTASLLDPCRYQRAVPTSPAPTPDAAVVYTVKYEPSRAFWPLVEIVVCSYGNE